MPNKEKLLRVADAIENHEIDLGFNMNCVVSSTGPCLSDRSGHKCKTVACIAGWTLALFQHDKFEQSWTCIAHRSMRTAANILGLDNEEQDKLFSPWMDDRLITAREIDDKQAVRTLRHFANSGEIDFRFGRNP